jgi:L,D-peptidoglycan transpeptidase YkuD (ErfK/YbiS/YcfS/YnhG family)
MVIMTGPKLGSTHGTLRIFNLSGSKWKQVMSAPCRFGTYGLVDGNKRKEGSRTTPTGIWWPGTWVWGWHKKAPSGTKMPYRQTTKNVWWSWERNSTYNTWVVSSRKRGGEHLVDVRIQYEFAISTGYNAPPNKVVQGRGTAIFLHVFDPPYVNNGLSAGCIGISRANMIRVFRILDPALKPSFAIGTEKSGTPTSIQAY